MLYTPAPICKITKEAYLVLNNVSAHTGQVLALTTPEDKGPWYLPSDCCRASILVKALTEDLTSEAKWEVSSKISSSDLVSDDDRISGTNCAWAFTFFLAYSEAFFHVPLCRMAENVQTTRASWGFSTNARWNANNANLFYKHMWSQISHQSSNLWQMLR